jgi:hypothetical protein
VTEGGGHRVQATRHAVERAHKRLAGRWAPETRAEVGNWVEHKALAALIEGRSAKTLPRWCVRGAGGRAKLSRAPGTCRYLWDEQRSSVFVVKRERDPGAPGRPLWLVLSVLAPTP